MINEAFKKTTDQLINAIQDNRIQFENGNVLIAKVRVDRITSGGIHIHDDYADREEFKSGFARILALPNNYSGSFRVGQYILFSHETRYYLYPAAIREILQIEIEKNFLYTVQDNNIILTIESENLK